jgi:hypothetical protein
MVVSSHTEGCNQLNCFGAIRAAHRGSDIAEYPCRFRDSENGYGSNIGVFVIATGRNLAESINLPLLIDCIGVAAKDTYAIDKSGRLMLSIIVYSGKITS